MTKIPKVKKEVGL